MITKGKMCSLNGRLYEQFVNEICKHKISPHLNIPLSTCKETSLGGCTNKKDLSLNWEKKGDIGMEIKCNNAPDWIQTTLTFNETRGLWQVKDKKNILRDQINRILKSNAESLFKAPPMFLSKPEFRYEEWENEKESFKDIYIPIHNQSICNAYYKKGIHYIQLRDYGLYHTHKDVCNFGTSKFVCKQRLRIRCKRHGRKCVESGNHVPSSVVASFRPVYSSIKRSKVSIEDI
jgi:hypothetical protein